MQEPVIFLAVTNDLTYDRRMQRICTSLAKTGASVTLIGRRWPATSDFKPDGYTGVRLPCWFHTGFLFYAEYNIRLAWYLLLHHYTIACACDLDTVVPVRFVSGLKRRKTVYDAHEYFTEVPELTHRPVTKAIWALIAKLTVKGFDLRYTVGEEIAGLMQKRYKAPFHIIRNIAPQPVIAFQQEAISLDRERILFYQGALNVGRGLDTCIEAMVHLPAWRLWMAGEGDISAHLQKKAIDLGVGDRITFLGWVPPDDLPGLLRRAKLAVNLREGGSLNDFYSLPNKFFDAMHAGLPSINMAYPEYVRICSRHPCSILLDKVEVSTLVEAILHVDQHPEIWTAMADACREAAQVYTWEKEAVQLTELYARIH